MAVVVAFLAIAVFGGAAFATKVVFFKTMAEVWKKPPQLRSASTDSTDLLEVQKRKVASLATEARNSAHHE